jgi:hypothetical protein
LGWILQREFLFWRASAFSWRMRLTPIAPSKKRGTSGRDSANVADKRLERLSASNPCAYRESNPGILVVQSAQDRATENAPNCLGGA